MLRSDDYNSNIVARFPVDFVSETVNLTEADGALNKLIFTASEYSPGSVIHSLIATNNTLSSQTIFLTLGSDEATAFFSFEMTSGQIIDIITELKLITSNVMFDSGLKLSPACTFYARVQDIIAAGESVDITLFGSNY